MPKSNSTTTSVISVKGRFLYDEYGSRFFVKGIGFPVPPPSRPHEEEYNETAWVGVLHQLKNDLRLDINTVRVYRMDPNTNYSGFFHAAAELGVYVLVPLTAAKGDGDLDRDKPAPRCYHRKLLHYGVSCLENYLQYPNVLAGVVSNEVMNSLKTWRAAPCVKAYTRDLKTYMASHFNRTLPLLYTAQDSGIGAAIDNVKTMQLTANYLSCGDPAYAIDIFGINVESWCSSNASFRYNEDGTDGPYYKLWKGMQNVSTALIFSEMGCPQSLFNRDNKFPDKTRTWKNIPVVLGNMSDSWSGFVAYAYDGSPDFNMMTGGPWNGKDVLQPKEEMFNFRDQLAEASSKIEDYSKTTEARKPPTCESVAIEMETCCNGEFPALYNVNKISNYAMYEVFPWVLLVIILLAAAVWWKKRRSNNQTQLGETETTPLSKAKYGSIS